MIRPAESRDEPVVRSLQAHLREPSPTLVGHAIRTGLAYVSLADGQIVGYLLATGGRSTHVAELVVAPGYRRAGRGDRLLRRLLADTTGRVTLFVHPDNDAARALYEQVGFQQVGRRRDFYEDADALVLAFEG